MRKPLDLKEAMNKINTLMLRLQKSEEAREELLGYPDIVRCWECDGYDAWQQVLARHDQIMEKE